MTQKEIADLMRANLRAQPSDPFRHVIDEVTQRQPDGQKHFCTIMGIEAAAAAIAEKMAA